MSHQLDDWIAREAIAFSVDSATSFNAAVDKLINSLTASVELLGLGEALHGSEEILTLRNRMFERLVEAHGYSAIAIESSFPRARIVNEYVAGRGPSSYDEVKESGFSHNFGRLEANRQLIEWMRHSNSEHAAKIHFYGFDSPTEMMGSDSPRQLLNFVLDYLASSLEHRQRIDSLLGDDADWENPAAMFDPAKSIGSSPAAEALRIATEELISELNLRRPEFARSDEGRYLEAAQHASLARHLLNYHAAVARPSSNRTAELLDIRDAIMADNLAYMISRERSRGKIFTFAHNTHLQCGIAQWQLGPQLLKWWPAGAHLHQMLGPRYAVIGSAVGVSDAHGIAPPEPGTLEAILTGAPRPARFVPTHKIEVPAGENIPVRSGSTKNSTYFPLTRQSLSDFDWLVMLD